MAPSFYHCRLITRDDGSRDSLWLSVHSGGKQALWKVLARTTLDIPTDLKAHSCFGTFWKFDCKFCRNHDLKSKSSNCFWCWFNRIQGTSGQCKGNDLNQWSNLCNVLEKEVSDLCLNILWTQRLNLRETALKSQRPWRINGIISLVTLLERH